MENRSRQLEQPAELPTLQNVVSTIDSTLEALGAKTTLSGLLRRHAIRVMAKRLAWKTLPLLGVGLTLWGVYAWRQKQRGARTPTLVARSGKQDHAVQDARVDVSW